MRRRHACLAAVALTFLLADGGDTPVPWPHGSSPSTNQLADLVEEATTLADRERAEEELEAIDQGEDSEHIVVAQDYIDQALYGFGDIERLFLFGDALFSHEFRAEDGYGDSFLPKLQRVHSGVRGGLDTFSCQGCHAVGGADGAGTFTQNALLEGDGDHQSSANRRNAPNVIGLGFVQALGVEMTTELLGQRQGAIDAAVASGVSQTVELTAKGVPFGYLTAYPDGSVDSAEIDGIDTDLVVKPFGWKGNVARLRRFVEDAARVHFGVQSHVLALGYEQHPDPDKLGPGPNWYDPDNDGKIRELEEGILTATAVYLSMLESPVTVPPFDDGLRARWANGANLFEDIGCADCHRPSLHLLSGTWVEMPDTTAGAGVVVDLLNDGDHPKSFLDVQLYSDLKRHDVGDNLADVHLAEGSDIPRSVFLTRPLWGLAESAPYLHDGSTGTIPEAILAHGGEATESRDAFAALSSDEQADVHIFLLSLTREPRPRIPR